MGQFLIVDDHEIVRSGLHRLLLKSFPDSIIDDAYDGESALLKIKAAAYDLIILDINIPDTDTAGLVTQILEFEPSTRILMFSVNYEMIYARRYLQLGAMGYLNKSAHEDEIIKAIDNVLKNKKYVTAVVLEHLAHDELFDKKTNPFIRLSTRETQILYHMLKGEGVTEISEQLAVESSTVGTYKSRIYKKLNCNSINDITSLARIYNFSFA